MKKSFRLPKAGVYTLQAPSSFPSEAFGVARGSGALTVQIDPTIVGPTDEGTVLKFTRVSGKVFQRDGQNVSMLGDYLRACGVQGVFASAQDLADAVELTAGTTYQARLDWSIYKDGGKIKLDGMKNFPVDPATGEYQSWIEHPTETEERNGELVAKRVYANLRITDFIPA